MPRGQPKRVGTCAHCGRVGRIYARGLSHCCYERPEVRALYQGPRTPGRRGWTARELRDLREWRAAGVAVAECARRLGRTVKQVYGACRRDGLKAYSRKPAGPAGAVPLLRGGGAAGGAVMPRGQPKRVGTCAHCGRVGRIYARGLSHCCYERPEIRALYQGPRTPGRRGWTARELRDLAAMRAARLPLRECARRLGRTVKQARGACQRDGLKAYSRKPAEYREGVRRLSRPGRTDRQVARLLGCSVATVVRYRKALGIPPGVGSAEGARRGGRRVVSLHGEPARQWRDANLVAAARDGWPPGCSPGMARVLATLEGGPLSSAALAAGLGVRRCTVQSHLCAMRRHGWVTGGRRGKAVPWELTPGVAAGRAAALLRKGAC